MSGRQTSRETCRIFIYYLQVLANENWAQNIVSNWNTIVNLSIVFFLLLHNLIYFRNVILPKEKERVRGKDSREYDEDSDYYIDDDEDDDEDDDNILSDMSFDKEISKSSPKVQDYK